MGLSQKKLKSLLRYDPLTGLWRWRVDHGRWGRIKAGTIAGTVCSPYGHNSIRIDGKHYLTSRLAFFYMRGRWPRRTVDHADCDPTNERWDNLRKATHQQQQRNRRGYSKTGFKGVKEVTGGYGFSAHLVVDKKNIYLGKRDTPEEAHALYCAAARKQYGEFVRLDYGD